MSCKADGRMARGSYTYKKFYGRLRQPHHAVPNVDMESRQMQILTTVTAPKASNGIDPHKFSNWRKRIRVTARIRRLAVKIRLRKYDQNGKEGSPTP